MSTRIQSLESKEVKLRIRVVPNFMDNLIGRKQFRDSDNSDFSWAQ